MNDYGNNELSSLSDKNGNVPKIGDFIRITLFEGIENVIDQIKEDEKFGYRPSIIKYLEFEIFDGVLRDNDIHMKDIYRYI
jgi:hypothetical protein